MAFSAVLEGLRAPGDTAGDRLIAAARELSATAGAPTFTVQQAVEAAGCSLKAFYRNFTSKDELLLALFHADNQAGADLLAARLEQISAPRDRLRAVVEGLFELVATGNRIGYTAVVVREHLRLAESHPARLREAIAPMIDLLDREIRRAAAAGEVRCEDSRAAAFTVFHTVSAHIHALVLEELDADPATVAGQVWRFCFGGLGGHPQ